MQRLRCLFLYIIILFLNKFLMGLLGFSLVQKYYPYFAIGLLINKFKMMSVKRSRLVVIQIIAGILFLVMVCFWYRLPSRVPSEVCEMTKLLNNIECYRFMTAICGCIFFLLLFHKFESFYENVLVSLGRMTLSIYILNYPLIWCIQMIFGRYLTFSGNVIAAIISVLMILFMAKSLHEVIGNIKYLNILLLGKRK